MADVTFSGDAVCIHHVQPLKTVHWRCLKDKRKSAPGWVRKSGRQQKEPQTRAKATVQIVALYSWSVPRCFFLIVSDLQGLHSAKTLQYLAKAKSLLALTQHKEICFIPNQIECIYVGQSPVENIETVRLTDSWYHSFPRSSPTKANAKPVLDLVHRNKKKSSIQNQRTGVV